MDRGSRAITTAHFLSAADSSRGAPATSTYTTWDAAKKTVVHRSAEELLGEAGSSRRGDMEGTKNPQQLSGKQQLAALGIRQPLASPFEAAGDPDVCSASTSAAPPSPSGKGTRRSQAGLSAASLTYWLADGEEARSPRGGLIKRQPEQILDPEGGGRSSNSGGSGNAGGAQLDNICDSVSETVDAALEQLRHLQRTRSSSSSNPSSLSRSYSKGLSRLTSLKAAVASAVGAGGGSSGGSSKSAAGDILAQVNGFMEQGETCEEESSGGPSSPKAGSGSSSKGNTFSSLSKVFRRAPGRVASLPVLPYEGDSSSSRPATRADGMALDAGPGWVGAALASGSSSSSSSSQGTVHRQGSSADISPFGEPQQQATFASSSSSGKLSRAGSAALPGIATDAAAADGSTSSGSGAVRAMIRQPSSRLGVMVGPGVGTDDGELPGSPKSKPPAAAEPCREAGTPVRIIRKSMSMGVASSAVAATPSPPMTPRTRSVGLTIDVSSSSTGAAAGPPEAPPSGSMSPLARARHALVSRNAERVQALDGSSAPMPVPPSAADASDSAGSTTWAVRSPRSMLGRSGSMKPWESAPDASNTTSSNTGNSPLDNTSAYQQSNLSPGRLTLAANARGVSEEVLGSKRVGVASAMKRNVSFAMPGALQESDEMYAGA